MKIKLLLISLLLFVVTLCPLHKVYADSSTQTSIKKGINYLGTELNGATGQIQGGSTADASPWAAIAFSANDIDPSTVKTSTNAPSLIDYLQTNHPTMSTAATEWEKWILAISAAGLNPYSFGGTNYVSTLESSSYYNSNQIGNSTSVTDDWFGVMALIASGIDKTNSELTDSLSFILSHQNSDGGFGYAATAGSDGNDTAAAIQALVDAQNYGVSNASLSAAITNSKTYILKTQDKSGGFLYDLNPWTTAPDSDSTTWAIMALNALGLQNTDTWNNAATWLISQQSATDGGFTSCDQWDPNTYVCTGYGSNSTTTSHALIGLTGKGWVVKFFDASNITPTPTVSVTSIDTPSTTPAVTATPAPTPTPTPILTSSGVALFTPTQTVIPIPTVVYTPADQKIADVADTPTSNPTPTTTQEVLGVQTTGGNKNGSPSNGQMALAITFLGIGIFSLGAYGFRRWKGV